MVLYNFKKIQVVPTARDFIDIVLSKTQRKTPTEIHKSYPISRIRAFYMRKVRYTQQNYHDKLTQMITDFPLLDDIHPFYADLINILYDRDHYKLALGQINNARHLIDNLAKDYVRLLKYGDSLYRCKQLKRAGMGRMCTLMKRLGPSLEYLEQVRQHLARLPSIDPTTRTIIVCGYPNVGKSSFMNKLTRANVDVQPYAFTTKSLFVGHTDYKYMAWQVIDTPGILDHPIEERNTIEMLSITALAHLQACVLYVIDLSEQCGHTIKEQVSLFHSIKPLFAGKPLIVAINKIDVIRPENMDQESWAMIQSLAEPSTGGIGGTQIVPMSTLTEEGVAGVKQVCCDTLLEARVEKKLRQSRLTASLNRIQVTMPTPRDERVRGTSIPQSVMEAKAKKAAGSQAEESTEDRAARQFEESFVQQEADDSMWARGEVPGMNSTVWQEKYQLKNPEWRFDIIPQILDGHNVFDFVDPDIDALMDELEREEDVRMDQFEKEQEGRIADEDDELDEEEMKILKAIRKKKEAMRVEDTLGSHNNPLPRSIATRETRNFDTLQAHLESRGFDEEQAQETVDKIRERSKSRSRVSGRKRERSSSRPGEEGLTEQERKKFRQAERSRSRATSLTPTPGSGMKDLKAVQKAKMKADKIFRKRNMKGKKGESDNVVLNMMPKHLYSGKRGIGKTDRR